MKRTVVLGLMLALAATSANAAVSTKKVTKKKAVGTVVATAAQAATPAPAEAAPAVAPAPAATAASPAEPLAAVAPVAQTTTAPAEVAKAPVKKFSGSVISWNEYNMLEVKKRDNRQPNNAYLGVADLYIRLRYALTDRIKLGFGQDVSQNVTNALNEGKVGVDYYDPFLSASMSNIATLPGDIKFSAASRIYLPISQVSRDAGQIAQINVYGTLAKAWGNFDLNFTTRQRAYIQQNTVYKNTMAADAVSGTTMYGMQNILTANYKFNDTLSAYQAVGLFETFRNGTSVTKRAPVATNAYAETGLVVGVTEAFELSAGLVTYDRDLRNNGNGGVHALALYGEESNYFLAGTVNF